MELMMEFRHEPLKLSADSIRLFQVQSGTKNDIIRIRITQYALHRRPPYIAISYTWGSASELLKIHVNGRPFGIHPNLWHLLYHLRQRGESQFLWADALCIDQKNLVERNFHVQLMSQIYDRAESTIVWLGLPSNDRWEARGLDFIREMSSYSEISFKDLYLTPAHQQRWQNLVRLCQCVYWTRTWIIQEFLRAKKIEVLCGTASLHWDCFEVLVGVITDLYKESEPHWQAITELIQTIPFRLTKRRMFHQHSSLRDLLHEFYDSQCAEPRDKIYGILGIADDCGENPTDGSLRGPQPDYAKHIVEVYVEVIDYLKQISTNQTVAPLTALLVQQSLRLTHEQICEFMTILTSKAPSENAGLSDHTSHLSSTSIILIPDYVNLISDVLPSYTSIRDLRQKLETFDWSKYVGVEIPQRKAYNNNKNKRRQSSSSAAANFSLLPSDLIQSVLNAASGIAPTSQSISDPLDTLITNHPNTTSFSIPPNQITLHPEDKRRQNNPSLAKPQIVIEYSDTLASPVRLGFACTDAQRGDLIVQFQGLDLAFIARRIRSGEGIGGLRIIGTALMVVHSGLELAQQQQQQDGDAMGRDRPWMIGRRGSGGVGGGVGDKKGGWISGFLGRYCCTDEGEEIGEEVVLRTDPLSLGHILMDAI